MARSSIRSWARCSGWAASRRRWSSRSITRSTPASQSSATPAAPAGSTVLLRRSPMSVVPTGRITSYDRYVVDTGRCPYFAKHPYCSICLPVCVYKHKKRARDFETGESPRNCFPRSSCSRRRHRTGSRRRQRVPSVSEAQSFMRLLIAVAPVALVLCAAPGIVAPVSAQPGTASLSGRILDPQGATAEAATVTLRSRSTGATWVTASDSEGRFRFSMLPPGPYHLEADLTGFARAGRPTPSRCRSVRITCSTCSSRWRES